MYLWLIVLAVWSLCWPLSSTGTGETARGALSQTATAGERVGATALQRSTFLANMLAAPPNIALKVQPARSLRFSKSQLNGLLADLRHEVKAQVDILEGEMAEEERRRQKTASTWAAHGSPIWVPKEARGASAGVSGAEMSFLQRGDGKQPRFAATFSPELPPPLELTHSDRPPEEEETLLGSAEAAATQAAVVTEGEHDCSQSRHLSPS